MVFNAPWYISNETLHEDSGTPFVEDEINRLTNSYVHNLQGHPNEQVSHLQVPPAARDGCTDSGQQMCQTEQHDLITSIAYIRRTVTGQHLH